MISYLSCSEMMWAGPNGVVYVRSRGEADCKQGEGAR
jgi:hypothetical protein